MAYELTLEQYQGPLAKLLDLIEKRQLEISTISLAQVTEDFLDYVRTLPKVETSLLADFIVVASRLLYLKSKSLLPALSLSSDDEAAIQDLQTRLVLYRAFRPAMKSVGELWRGKEYSLHRPYLAGVFPSIGEANTLFYPGEGLTVRATGEALTRILHGFEQFRRETEVIQRQLITVEKTMEEIIKRLEGVSTMSFQVLSKEHSSTEVIGLFLAVLHLAREQHVLLEQTERFSDILIRNSRSANDREAG